MKRKTVLLLAVILLAAAGGAAAAFAKALPGTVPSADAVVLLVDGTPVTLQEYNLLMNREQSAVTNYFKLNYGADDQAGYWTRSFGGETPLEVLKQRADEQAVQNKTLQNLAKSQGLIADVSFSSLYADFTAMNRERSQSMGSGQTVYGLASFSLDQFYDYYMNNLKLKLQEKLGSSTLAPDDAEIRSYYDAHPQLYSNRDEYEVEQVSVPYGGSGQPAPAEAKLQAAQVLDAAKQGISLAQAALKAPDGTFGQLTFSSADESVSASPVQSRTALVQAVRELAAGQLSGIVDTGDSYSLIRVLSAKTGQAVPLEEVASQIREQLVRDKFAAYLDSQIKLAKVSIQHKNYDQITVNSEEPHT